jgi:hypothetical protein
LREASESYHNPIIQDSAAVSHLETSDLFHQVGDFPSTTFPSVVSGNPSNSIASKWNQEPKLNLSRIGALGETQKYHRIGVRERTLARESVELKFKKMKGERSLVRLLAGTADGLAGLKVDVRDADLNLSRRHRQID